MENTMYCFDDEHRDLWGQIYKYLSFYDISIASCASKYLNNIIDIQKERQKYKLGNKLIPINSLKNLGKIANYIFRFLEGNEKIKIKHVILDEQIVFIWFLLDFNCKFNVVTENVQRQIWEDEGYLIPKCDSDDVITISCDVNCITLSHGSAPSISKYPKTINLNFRFPHVKNITIKSAYEKYEKSGNIIVMMSNKILMEETIKSVEKKKRKYRCNIRAKTFHELCRDNQGSSKIVFNLSCPSYTSTELSIILGQVLYYKCETLEIYTINPGSVVSSLVRLFDYTPRFLDVAKLEEEFDIKLSYYGTYKVKKIREFATDVSFNK